MQMTEEKCRRPLLLFFFVLMVVCNVFGYIVDVYSNFPTVKLLWTLLQKTAV